MDKPEEYIKYVTGKVVDYMETPQEERKENRKRAKAVKEPWLTRWFGLAGLGLSQWLQARRTENDKSDDMPLGGQTGHQSII